MRSVCAGKRTRTFCAYVDARLLFFFTVAIFHERARRCIRNLINYFDCMRELDRAQINLNKYEAHWFLAFTGKLREREEERDCSSFRWPERRNGPLIYRRDSINLSVFCEKCKNTLNRRVRAVLKY